MKDLYDILGINKDATAADIKAAFRKRAKEQHPDTHEGTEAAMQDINRAYAILKDPTKRKAYDKGGEDAANESRRDRAVSYAVQIAGQLIEKNPPDIKQAINNLLESWKRSYTSGRRNKDRELRSIQAFKTRIVNAPDYDIISMVTDEAAKKIEAELKEIDDDFEIRMDAIKILDQYTFADTVQDAPEFYGMSVTGSTMA